MILMIAGLVLFLGIHSISIVALPLRDRMAAASEIGWKLLYGAISLIGLLLIVKGYAAARLEPVLLYVPPYWLRHLAMLLLLPVFILFLAPYFPGKIKQVTKHPQLIGLKLWALSHLLVNGMLADVLLFGSFLAWAVIDRISLKRRQTRAVPSLPESGINDVIVVIAGLAAYAAFIFYGHYWVTGMPLISAG